MKSDPVSEIETTNSVTQAVTEVVTETHAERDRVEVSQVIADLQVGQEPVIPDLIEEHVSEISEESKGEPT